MSKKSLITSLVLGAVLTLTLGVYTIVSAIIAVTTPHHDVVSVAYASKTLNNGVWEDLKITDFANYSVEQGTLELSYDDENEFLAFDAEDNSYSLKDGAFDGKAVGAKLQFTAVATTDKYGSTTTYNATIYKQGTGYDENDPEVASKDNAFLVTNADDLLAVQDNSERGDNTLRNAYVLQVEDVDLAGKNWKGISTASAPFMGTYDGDGHKVKNMTININADNYEEYIHRDTTASNNLYLEAGFFTRLAMATVKGLSIVDANITIAENLRETLAQYTKVIDEANCTLVGTRVGLVAGDMLKSVVDGTYTRQIIELDDENNEVATDVNYTSTISGKIAGLQYEKAGFNGGFGGVAGLVTDKAAGDDVSKVTAYAINATISTSGEDGYNFVGGVVGKVFGHTDLTHPFEVYDVNVTLNSAIRFLNQDYVGGAFGYAENAKIYATGENVNTINLNAVDADNATIADLNAVITASNFNERLEEFSYIAGVAAFAKNSTFETVNANANISVWTKVSAGFVNLQSSTVKDVAVAGTLTGFEASGLARETNNSIITYTQDEFVAANVNLYAHNAAALVDHARNTNITGLADTTVKSEISAYGYNVTNANKNNIVHSSGLVGYYYATDSDNTYTLQGFAVDTTINNGVDMAGVATYVGTTDIAKSKVLIKDVTVNAKLNSYATDSYSTTHKVGGAVATVYGNAELNGLAVDVKFNENHAADKKYGVAMFGGLVARVAGTKVDLVDNTVAGMAYVNDSLYSKSFEDNEYKQITVGGLVGAIAGYGKEVPVGGHPTYEEAEIGETGFAVGETFDNIVSLDVSTMTISGNNVGVDMVVDYVDSYEGQDNELMYKQGYRTRSAGILAGLIMNTAYDNVIDLGSNVVTGSLQANAKTYTYRNGSSQDLSSMGYGSALPSGGYEFANTPKVVGSTFDYTTLGNYADGWNLPAVTVAE